jgi:restriction endonuclease Mrr
VAVDHADLEPAIHHSIENIQQSVLDTHHRATSSNRETLHKEVLLALRSCSSG